MKAKVTLAQPIKIEGVEINEFYVFRIEKEKVHLTIWDYAALDIKDKRKVMRAFRKSKIEGTLEFV
jgi:hypothetical protein